MQKINPTAKILAKNKSAKKILKVLSISKSSQ
ncbi:hypothetical protein MSSD1_196 [Mycoplasmopsis synoviae]